MINESNNEKESLSYKFGFDDFYDNKPRKGWLLNYYCSKNEYFVWKVQLYFVDENSENFKVTLDYYPSIIVECKEDTTNVEEYLRKKYEGYIQATEVVNKINIQEFNHLNKPPKEFLKVYFKSENFFQQTLKDIKELLNDKYHNIHENEIYSNYCNIETNDDISYQIMNIHEFDIPVDVQVANMFNIRCGAWFNVSFNGEKYSFVKDEKLIFPDLRTLAFDIETTKPPLKFPNSEFDSIMMISIMTEDFGELIINRKIVSKDIQEFDYEAKEDIRGSFRVFNEDSEELLLIRFIEVIQSYKPHIITTYNGGFFDWPFVNDRMKKYKLDLESTIQYTESNEYFDCPFIIHLDCYKWVKRDSYLPMNNQGLKDVTRIKLGYSPDEIDPEDMVRCAREDPQKLASYSVSDAVATFFIYLKFVQPHIYSICSLIPVPPVQALCKGSGTLCEALLLSEAANYQVLIPQRKKTDTLEFYNGHIAENLTYVGGHVESLRAGIFRSDFDTNFNIDKEIVDLIIDNFDDILEEYLGYCDFAVQKQKYIEDITKCVGNITSKGCIFHLDVGAMYPNIILTNRLQPISVVNEDICIRCDFNNEENQCKRKLEWVARSEYIPAEKNEIRMIKAQLENEYFYTWDNDNKNKVLYSKLPQIKQDSLLKERVIEYSKNIYKKAKKTEVRNQEITICQREIPFYVETVRKFKDQRYIFKNLYKKAMIEYEKNKTKDNSKKIEVCNSIQVAYKCILNSFYGYTMREGSRWFSLEMAATVCNVGGEIIKLTKELIDKIGIALELDTDGIWCFIPARFPCVINIDGRKISMLGAILNYFVCKKYTNYQYQVKKDDQYQILPQNSIFFEVDGPYKSMIIPSSTEENKLSKKRYVVFDFNDKIVELKGFELKRRGELNFIKKFQEDVFNHFNDGNSIQECYDSLAHTCNYWLDIIYSQGVNLDEDSLFYLFSESRNMSKSIDGYANKKSNILGTAKKLSEFLGDDILEEKLKCEFIMSRYPLNAPTADRAIPVMIFKSPEKTVFLKKWLKSSKEYSLSEIIDWEYYRKRFESILQRLIVIPAHLQDIKNPINRVVLPQWIKNNMNKERLHLGVIKDIEDFGSKKKLSDVFYNNKRSKQEPNNIEEIKIADQKIDIQVADQKIVLDATALANLDILDYSRKCRSVWLDFFRKRISYKTAVIKVEMDDNSLACIYYNNKRVVTELKRKVLLDVLDPVHFKDYNFVEKYNSDTRETLKLAEMNILQKDFVSEKFLNFFDHFSIRKVYSFNLIYEILDSYEFELEPVDVLIISSFDYQKKPVYCVTSAETMIISELKHSSIQKSSLINYKNAFLQRYKIVVISKFDPNLNEIRETFKDYHVCTINLLIVTFVDSFENILKSHLSSHLNFKLTFHKIFDISRFFKIPLLNVDLESLDINRQQNDFNLLDMLLFKEFRRKNILFMNDDCIENSFSQRYVKEEVFKPGYNNSYSVEFEVSNSLILSIIEFRSFQQVYGNYDGYSRQDFLVLRDFIKSIVLQALKDNLGAKFLLEKIGYWLKKGSCLISKSLREVIEINHTRYIITLLSKLKEAQFNIISSTKELLIIGTDKKTMDGCNQFIEYLRRKVSGFPGYELLNLSIIRVFEKLSFVNPESYYSVEDNFIRKFSDIGLPEAFLKIYFSDCEITNSCVYDFVKHMDYESVKIVLKIISFKRDVYGLASNCYKLIGQNSFIENEKYDVNLTIFCQKCGIENFLRKRCLKCYVEFDKVHVEQEAEKYLKFCWIMQAMGDKYCNKCNFYSDKRLREYCRCGGRFTRRNYMTEIQNINGFVGTKAFNDKVNVVFNYFK